MLMHPRTALLAPGYSETAEHVELADFGLDHPDRTYYTASPFWALRLLMRRFNVTRADSFLEYGCGKGRVVLEAAYRYPFRRVLGVEIADDLSEIGRRLVQREQGSLRCDVDIVTADAADFRVPDDVTYAYLYNSFSGETFRRVRANLLASLERAPRQLRLIYLCPEEHEALTGDGSFTLARRVRVPRVMNGAAIYEAGPVTPIASPSDAAAQPLWPGHDSK